MSFPGARSRTVAGCLSAFIRNASSARLAGASCAEWLWSGVRVGVSTYGCVLPVRWSVTRLRATARRGWRVRRVWPDLSSRGRGGVGGHVVPAAVGVEEVARRGFADRSRRVHHRRHVVVVGAVPGPDVLPERPRPDRATRRPARTTAQDGPAHSLCRRRCGAAARRRTVTQSRPGRRPAQCARRWTWSRVRSAPTVAGQYADENVPCSRRIPDLLPTA